MLILILLSCFLSVSISQNTTVTWGDRSCAGDTFKYCSDAASIGDIYATLYCLSSNSDDAECQLALIEHEDYVCLPTLIDVCGNPNIYSSTGLYNCIGNLGGLRSTDTTSECWDYIISINNQAHMTNVITASTERLIYEWSMEETSDPSSVVSTENNFLAVLEEELWDIELVAGIGFCLIGLIVLFWYFLYKRGLCCCKPAKLVNRAKLPDKAGDFGELNSYSESYKDPNWEPSRSETYNENNYLAEGQEYDEEISGSDCENDDLPSQGTDADEKVEQEQIRPLDYQPPAKILAPRTENEAVNINISPSTQNNSNGVEVHEEWGAANDNEFEDIGIGNEDNL